MNAWNGVSAPVAPVPSPDERHAAGFAEPAHLHEPEPQRQKQPGPEQHDDDPRHEQRVGDGLDAVGELGGDHSFTGLGTRGSGLRTGDWRLRLDVRAATGSRRR